tara:strand:- start:414 stop:2417 length:2004 start_codon:yes stop_codon:yes gene_type:complete
MSVNFTIYELYIKIKTNVKDLVDFKRSMLKIPSQEDDESVITLNYSDNPFFTHDYKYPLNKLKSILNYKQLINIFFNENEFIKYIREYGEPANASSVVDDDNTFNYNSTLYKNEIMNENIITMLEVLFPTSVDVVNNLHTSYQYIKGQFSNKPLNIFNFKPKQYIAMNVDGKDRLIDKVILYNDVVNHPLYNNAIRETRNFLNRYEKENNQLYENTILRTRPRKQTKPAKNETKPAKNENLVTNYRLNTLTKLKYPNYNVNNYYFQELINAAANTENERKDTVKKEFHKLDDIFNKEIENTDNRKELFYRFIRYLSDRYIFSEYIPEVPFYEKMIKGCICDIDLQGSNLRKEIYISVKLHDDKINESNINSQKCDYYNNTLGDMFERGFRQKYLLDEPVVTQSSSSNPLNNRATNSNKSKSNSNGLSKQDIALITSKIQSSERLKEFTVENVNTGSDYKFDTKRKNNLENDPRKNALNYFISEQQNLYKMYNESLNRLPGVDFQPDKDKLVANIANNKLLPNDIQVNLVDLFAEVLRLWMKIIDNNDNLQAPVLKKDINNYNKKWFNLIRELDTIISTYEIEYNRLQLENVSDKDPLLYNNKYIIRVSAFYKHFFKHIIDGTINRAPKSPKPPKSIKKKPVKSNNNTKKNISGGKRIVKRTKKNKIK